MAKNERDEYILYLLKNMDIYDDVCDVLNDYHETFEEEYTKRERERFYENIHNFAGLYMVFKDMFTITCTLDPFGDLMVTFPDGDFGFDLRASGLWHIYRVTGNEPRNIICETIFDSKVHTITDLELAATCMSDVYTGYTHEHFKRLLETCYHILNRA